MAPSLAGHYPVERCRSCLQIKRTVAVAGVAAAVGCIVATAGVCTGFAVAAAAASFGSDVYGWRHKEMSTRQYEENLVFNGASLVVPRARSVRLAGAHTAAGLAERAALGLRAPLGAKMSLSLRAAWRIHPIRSTIRTAFNVYAGYQAVSGRWGW